MTYILGLNAYHGDSSACLIKDGQLVAAAEEERFRRIKHWAGFPTEAIRYCLDEAGIRLSDVDHIAINRDPKAHRLRKILFTLRYRADPAHVLRRLKNARKWSGVAEELSRAFPGERIAQVHHIEHHRAHLASAFFVSPYPEALAVSVDGSGDFTTTSWGMGQGSSLSVAERIFFPHSLGIFYEGLTQHLGFRHYGDEYKVMGLAPYGEPRFLNQMREIVRLRDDGGFRLDLSYFQHHTGHSQYQWNNESPSSSGILSPAIESLIGKARQPNEPLEQRHKDLARSIQAMYEEAFFHLLTHLHQRYPSDNLVLAGGCAYNSVANGKIHRRSPFKNSYIQSASGDAGGAIGAAFAVWFESQGNKRACEMDHAYWGPAFGDTAIDALLAKSGEEIRQQGCNIQRLSDEGELCRRVAAAIADGKVIGWFQGRMEWGPRALGNRSILGDPRRADMKDILNLKIKRRESFRPFAPSILREAVPQWFEDEDDVPFMMKVFPIREEKRGAIPAVAHVDGSGRLQTVDRATNPRYYGLIEEFGRITGIPILLNTSFNENEPVVCRPEEALACFLRTRMDMLVLGDQVVERAAKPAETAAKSLAAAPAS
ncbi:MAG TPA: carbamoyltransferase C-terminal domain-containing protein [Rhizomicrobium sp.]|nr:carbamoyltransferase C-terminal domain-containing protein [Rhizomicrobium sp.]